MTKFSEWNYEKFETAVNPEHELSRLDMQLKSNPEVGANIIFYLLEGIDGRSCYWLCEELLKRLHGVIEADRIERCIIDQWEEIKDIQRGNFIQGIDSDDLLLSTDFALRLFNHESSTVHDKHRIAACLAKTADRRAIRKLIPAILTRIGNYPDPHRQSILSRFIKNAELAFGSGPAL